ncbi:MAG: GHKL domain-containing protein [Chlorobi bacterium]|nr:GHKL domain-containing protein [Chlorobiota bacterium]
MPDHPIFSRKKIFILFLLVWIFIAVIHAWWLTSGVGIMISVSTLDSIVYNLLFIILAVVMWFPMRTLYQNRTGPVPLAGGYLLLVAVILTSWLAGSNGLIRILTNNADFNNPVLLPLAPWRIITGFFYTLVMILVYYLILYYEEIREKTEKEAELRAIMAENEIKALKAQLNPHFLFNTLNTMGNFIHSDPDKAGDMLVKLSQFLRYSLAHEEKQFVPLSRELDYISVYLDLLRMRYGKKWNFTSEIDDACPKAQIPVMILQPLIENAVRYAFGEKKENGLIRLRCKPDGKDIRLTIQNNFDPEVPSATGHGIGLKNIKKRLFLLYGRNNLLQVNRKEDIFEVTLRLPPIDQNIINHEPE